LSSCPEGQIRVDTIVRRVEPGRHPQEEAAMLQAYILKLNPCSRFDAPACPANDPVPVRRELAPYRTEQAFDQGPANLARSVIARRAD
jgi:hypothetical protein